MFAILERDGIDSLLVLKKGCWRRDVEEGGAFLAVREVGGVHRLHNHVWDFVKITLEEKHALYLTEVLINLKINGFWFILFISRWQISRCYMTNNDVWTSPPWQLGSKVKKRKQPNYKLYPYVQSVTYIPICTLTSVNRLWRGSRYGGGLFVPFLYLLLRNVDVISLFVPFVCNGGLEPCPAHAGRRRIKIG